MSTIVLTLNVMVGRSDVATRSAGSLTTGEPSRAWACAASHVAATALTNSLRALIFRVSSTNRPPDSRRSGQHHRVRIFPLSILLKQHASQQKSTAVGIPPYLPNRMIVSRRNFTRIWRSLGSRNADCHHGHSPNLTLPCYPSRLFAFQALVSIPG